MQCVVMDANQNKRQGLAGGGVAFGVVIGVVLSLLLDNWGWMGAGIAIGLVMGGMPLFGRSQRGGEAPGRDGGS